MHFFADGYSLCFQFIFVFFFFFATNQNTIKYASILMLIFLRDRILKGRFLSVCVCLYFTRFWEVCFPQNYNNLHFNQPSLSVPFFCILMVRYFPSSIVCLKCYLILALFCIVLTSLKMASHVRWPSMKWLMMSFACVSNGLFISLLMAFRALCTLHLCLLLALFQLTVCSLILLMVSLATQIKLYFI